MSQGNLAGQTLGQYQLRELLGIGGMGSVYRAYQVNLKREVAVKIISPELVNNAELMARFIREAEISAQLEHANIVPIHDFGTQSGVTYVVMRLLTGGSLSRRIEQRVEDGRPLISLGETAELLRQVASALDYAHSHNVIHRDIKPANIMFDNQGKPHVVDFGIAKLTRGGASFTQTGTAMGTPNFMPPEQWRGEELTPQADQYALGVMVYQLLTGRVPFDGDSAFVLMHKHLNEQPTPLSILRPDIPPAVMMVINRALAKDYRQRFQSCTAFAQAFEGAIAGNIGQSTGMFVFKVRPSQTNAVIVNRPYTPTGMGYNTPMPPRPNSKNPIIWMLGLALILVTGLFLLFVLSNSGNDNTSSSTQIAGGIDEGSATYTEILSDIDATRTQISLENGQILVAILDTPTLTDIPSDTPNPTNTLDVRQAARATTDQIATQTAESWTDTPTPDIDATIMAEVTLIYLEQLTMTATLWTNTPTVTPTPSRTPTVTPRVTPTLLPEQFALTPVAQNEDWMPYEREFDGVMMVLVPAGCFMMGSETGDDDEQPVHEQCFDEPFWIDKYEVTQAQFAQFGGQKANANDFTGINLPVENITWFEARDFCLRRGVRLSTEREWEYAARGPNNLIYPWGNEFVADNVVYSGNSNSRTATVGLRRDGASWVGAMDMSGNVWEWVSSLYQPYPYDEDSENFNDNSNARVLRSGSWGNSNLNVSVSNRSRNNPFSVSDNFGFRCSRSYP